VLVDVGQNGDNVYVQVSGEHWEPAVERWVAPGGRAGYSEDGELLMVEVFAGGLSNGTPGR